MVERRAPQKISARTRSGIGAVQPESRIQDIDLHRPVM